MVGVKVSYSLLTAATILRDITASLLFSKHLINSLNNERRHIVCWYRALVPSGLAIEK